MHPVTVAFEILDAEQETYHFIIDVIDACEGLTESETLVASKDLTVSLDRETYASPRLHVAARVDESTGYLCDTCDPFGFEKGMVLGAISHMHGWGDVKNPRREVRVVPFSALQGASSIFLDPKADEYHLKKPAETHRTRCLFVFKVECVALLRCQPVALKVWERDRGSQAFYLSEVARLMHQHGISPALLAEGSAGARSWIISEWVEYKDGSSSTHGAIEDMAEDGLRRIGELLAKVHRIDAKWVLQVREHLLRVRARGEESAWARRWLLSHQEYDSKTLGANRSVDLYARRPNTGFFLAHHGDRPVFQVSADCSPWAPAHSLARLLVTCHNDLHLDNVVFSSSAGRFFLVDIDQVGVGPAIIDLAYFISKLGDHMPHYKRAFLEGYLQVMAKVKNSTWRERGQENSIHWGLETLLIDCELAKLGTWYSPNMDPILSTEGKIYNLTNDDVVWRIAFAQKFAAMVRGSSRMQDHMRAKGLRGTLGSLSHGRFQTEGAAIMRELRQIALQSGQGPWYFANVSRALSELVRGPVSTPANFKPPFPWDGNAELGGSRLTTSTRITNYSSQPLANLEEVDMRSRDLLSREEEDKDEKDEDEQFIWKGKVLQRIAPGLLAARVYEEGSLQQSPAREKTFLSKNMQESDPA